MAVNVRVVNKRGFEQMLKAFRRACTDRGILHEWKKHEFYEKPSETRRKKYRQVERDRQKALNGNKRKRL
jgi:small subunit ribosomal protein S21